jgi:hypothetical protein
LSVFTNPYAEKHYLAVLQPYDPGGSPAGVVSLYYSTHGFTTEPGDTPSNTHFEGRLADAITFRRSMFQSGLIGGRSVPGYGVLRLANADGGLDHLADYAWDGRAITVMIGTKGDGYSDYTTIFEGTAQGIEFDGLELVVQLRDLQHKIDVPMQAALFAGTGGDEGVADLTGRRKPLCYGRCLNITPVMLNAASGTYMAHPGPIEDVDALYVGGVAYTKVGGSPAANQYSVNVSTGVATVGGAPVTGQVTCDVKGAKPSTYLTTVADIAKEIVMTQGGLTSGDLDLTSFTDLNTANSATVGIYINGGSERSILSVLDELTASIGGFYGFDRSGKFAVGRLEAPTGMADAAYDDTEVLELTRLPTAVPAWRIVLGYEPNWTVQVEFQVGGAPAAQRDFTARSFRHKTAEDAAVQTTHLMAGELKVNTLIDGAGDAGTEASRLLTLYKADRDVYRARLKVQPFQRELNDEINIEDPRYGLAAGKDFRVVSVNENSADNEVELELWG